MSALDKVLEIVAKSGPVLPVEVASKLKIDSFLASGYLSQLVDTGKVKASEDKVAGTSVYFVPGQDEAAEKRVKEIISSAQKTARTFAKKVSESPEIQKKREAFANRLKEIEEKEKKVIPVTLSKLKEDFIVAPGKQAVGGEHKVKVKQPEISYEIKFESEIPTSKSDEEEVEEAVSEIAKKPKKRGRKKKAPEIFEDGKTVQSALAFLVEAGADIISKELKRKGKDADMIILLPTKIGNIQMFAIVKEKKKVSEADLSMAYTEGTKRKLPILFITNGSLTKTSREYYESIAGFLKFKSLSE